MKTQAALAASLIKKELKIKYPHLKFIVTSQNYAGGSSIGVSAPNNIDAKELQADLRTRYQYGHFDGMTDSYEYSNSRDEYPQVSFIFVN